MASNDNCTATAVLVLSQAYFSHTKFCSFYRYLRWYF